MNVAEHVISIAGRGDFAEGVRVVCALTGVRAPAVYRWTYPVEQAGRGGRIPTIHQGPIIRGVRQMGIRLESWDFFDPSDLVPINDNVASDTVNNTETGPALPAEPREKTS